MSIGSGFIALFIFWHVNPGIVRFELFLFGIVSFSVGITNLFPRILSKRTSRGQVLATDGYRLLELFRVKFLPQEYATATELFTKKLYLESSMVLQNLIEAGNKNKYVLRLAISANLQAKDIQRGDALNAIFFKKHSPNSNDYCIAGYIKSMLKDEEAALGLYKKSITLDSDNVVALNNIGHSLIELKRFQEAIQYLDDAISKSPKFCLGHCNVGLAKIHLGDLEGGLEAIKVCLELDPNLADAHTSLGIYNLKKGNLTDAKRCFEKSKELGSDDISNDTNLGEVEEMMGNNI